MPLEIKELNIKVTVVEESPTGTPGTAPTSGGVSGSSDAAVVEACVEKVLEILKNKTER